MWISRIGLLLIAAIVLSACSSHDWSKRRSALIAATDSTDNQISVPPEHLPALRLGMTLDGVRGELRDRTRCQYHVRTGYASDTTRFLASLETDPLKHHFTLRRANADVLCVSAVVIAARYYFLFEDGLLTRIVSPLPPTWTAEYREDLEAPVRTYHAPEPDVAIRHLLEGPTLSPDEFVDSVKSRADAALTAQVRYVEPNPALDVASGLSDTLSIVLLRGTSSSNFKRSYLDYVHERERFNSFSISLGASASDVQHLLGPPTTIRRQANALQRHRHEGQPIETRSYQWPAPVVDVIFRDDRSIAVLADSFAQVSTETFLTLE
jgi:hypothetical protein